MGFEKLGRVGEWILFQQRVGVSLSVCVCVCAFVCVCVVLPLDILPLPVLLIFFNATEGFQKEARERNCFCGRMQAYGNSRILFADYNNFVNGWAPLSLIRFSHEEQRNQPLHIMLSLCIIIIIMWCVVTNLTMVPRFVWNL